MTAWLPFHQTFVVPMGPTDNRICLGNEYRLLDILLPDGGCPQLGSLVWSPEENQFRYALTDAVKGNAVMNLHQRWRMQSVTNIVVESIQDFWDMEPVGLFSATVTNADEGSFSLFQPSAQSYPMVRVRWTIRGNIDVRQPDA